MNKFKIFLIAVLIIGTHNIFAQDGIKAGLTKTEYWIDDAVNLKIEPNFSDSTYAAAFEVSYTKETLEFTGFETDNENVFVADTLDDGGMLTSAFTKVGKKTGETVASVTFSFKVKAEGEASVKLLKITEIDTELNETETVCGQEYQVNIVNPVPTPAPTREPSHSSSGGGGKSSGGGIVSLPKPTATPTPEIIPQKTPEPVTLPFEDVSPDSWAAEYILRLYEKGIISEDIKFRPDDKISRAEFIKLVTVAFDVPPVYEAASFEDCDKSAWYSSYISAAAAAGIVTGSDGKIYPDNNITRQDVCVILSRIIDVTELKDIEFADFADISDYAAEAVCELYSAGIISGMPDGSFKPLEGTTRAQAVKMICMATEVGK